MREKLIFKGKVLSGVGGLYRVITENGEQTECRARGSFRYSGISPYPGDDVLLEKTENGASVICEISKRRNVFVRPPAANIDKLFITIAAASPSPAYITSDKLICAAEYYGAEAIIIVTKSDLDALKAKEIYDIYTRSGYKVFVTSSMDGSGVDELRSFVLEKCGEKNGFDNTTSVFAGESGVGKSSMLNAIFPNLSVKTGAVSRKTARGKHTTRAVTLYPLDGVCSFTGAFIADTPGFGIFDISSIDDLYYEDVCGLFKEFNDYIGRCKYRKCTHLCEDGCAVVEAVKNGEISAVRHESYVKIYGEIKLFHPRQSKKKPK